MPEYIVFLRMIAYHIDEEEEKTEGRGIEY